MSGHSKWATTHRAKEANDAKRGKIFTKMARVITVAARSGSDPDTNFALRLAIERAKTVNMPKDNIARAIKRGAGGAGGAQIEELIYEGIGPANSQFVIKCLTDNKNRTASEIRHLFTRYGGSLGQVMWNFDQKGVIRILKEEAVKNNLDSEDFELELIDKGAEDIVKEEEGMTIYTAASDMASLKKFFEERGVKTESADIEYVAKSKAEAGEGDREKLEKFISEFDDLEDVADYYTNINI